MFGENMKNLQSESIKKFYAVNPKFSIFFLVESIIRFFFRQEGGGNAPGNVTNCVVLNVKLLNRFQCFILHSIK